MDNFLFSLPYINGHYPSYQNLEGQMHYVWTRFPNRAVLIGNIGNTGCCGSAEVVGLPDIKPSTLYNLIKDTKCSVFRLHYYKNIYEDLTKSIVELNKMMDGMANVTILMETYGKIYLAVEIIDEMKYRDFISYEDI